MEYIHYIYGYGKRRKVSNVKGKSSHFAEIEFLSYLLIPEILLLLQRDVRTVLLTYGISKSVDFIVILNENFPHSKARTFDHVPIFHFHQSTYTR